MKRTRRDRRFVRSLFTHATRRRLRQQRSAVASVLQRIEALECRTLLSATPTLTVTDANGSFTGKPFVATVSATVNNTPIPIAQSLSFSTYLGSTNASRVINVATDSLGNTFVTGWTNGSNFPTTSGVYETTGAADGAESAFVAKFDPSGNLVWSTLIDGSAGFAIAVDSSDNVYVAGEASQHDFQTTSGAYQTTATASSTPFIAKLNSSGTSLTWATYLGGSTSGEVDGIAVDSAGNVYVSGDTTATDFPLKNPIQAQNNGGSDAFISELNSAGSQLVFSTYLGGSGDDYPSSIALDPAGDIFVDGTTDSTDLQTTANAFQSTYGGGGSDAFVAKLNPGGAGLAYLTYLGGNGDVTGSDVEMAVDAEGDAYVIGNTDADAIPMVNAYQSTYSGGQDAYIAELNPSGTTLLNSTYYGDNTEGSSIAIDSSGNVYIGGQIDSGSIPTVDPASTSGDLYVAEFNLSTATLVYSSYVGATNDNSIIDPVGVTSNGNLILAGDTFSSSFPTQNAYQSTMTGTRDAFVAGFQPELTVSYYAGSTATGTPLPGAPSAVGTYTVVATFTSTDPNYTNAQSDPVTFTISAAQQSTPTVTAVDNNGAYDGSPFTASATALGNTDQPVSGTFAFTYYVGTSVTGTGTSTPPVDAGTDTVVASFNSSDPDYSNAQSQPVTFTIALATPTVAFNSAGGTFTGNPLPADATVAGVVPGVDNTPGSTLESVPLTLTYYAGPTATGTPLSGAPSAVGTYTVVASFPGSQDYTSASESDTYSITPPSNSPPAPVITVSDPNGTFTGQPFVATVSATVNNAPIPIAQSLNFSTYLGSSSTSRAINVTTDNFGNTFVTGFTNGTNFPTTSGAYETTGAADGSRSAFVAKFDPSGNLVWSTLIDGAAGFAIAVDASDNVYVAGQASGTDFQTTTGAYQTTANASSNAFIAKLNSTGSNVLWATFLGGSDFGEVDGIAVDNAGNVYVSGDTTATDFPLKNPIQAQNNGGSDAFISELNSAGSQLVFSTYLGGSGDEFPSAIGLDAAGDIFLTGTTDSTDLQTTANAIQPTYGGGDSDAFVAKLNPSGAGLAYLTYLGGSGDVTGSDVEMAVDAAGDAYVVGTTDADTIPMVNAYQSTYSGGQEAFIAELNPTGTAILNSTYFGSGTYASGMAMDSQGNVYISGDEFDSIPTVDPVSTSGDNYVAELNLSTSTLVFSTTLGASDDGSIITPMGVTSDGNIILAGDTRSTSLPTQNAYQSSLTGSRDAFVTGLQPELTVSYYSGTTATGTPLPGAPSAVGTYTVVANFISTDPNYTDAQSAPVTFTISQGQPLTPNVTAFDQSGNYNGSPFAATATALGSGGQPVSGTFAFTYYVGTSVTGSGTSTPPVDAGTYTVVAAFTSTDSNYSNAQSAPVTFMIAPATTSTSLVASAATSVYGQSVSLTATVASHGGTPTAGTVTFYEGTTPLGTSGINNGVASLPVTTLAAGFDVVTATYSGDGLDFAGSSSVLSPASLIETIAGTGVAGFNGNGIAATSAEINNPVGIAVNSAGDVFFVDSQNNEVREVNATTGLISVVAGTGVAGYNGDGIPATSAELNFPSGLAIDSKGDLFIADQDNQRIREVNASTGLISTVAGNGGTGYNGDGIPATSAELYVPDAVAVDSQGNVYIADILNNRVREVSATTGLISTIAGTGVAGYNGNDIAASSAELNLPRGVAVDAAGDVFIADSRNNLVREVVASTGDIINVAGTGTAGYTGDGIAATSAELNFPVGLAVDPSGNLFIDDNAGQRIREVSATTGLISTVAGTGVGGYNGDGIAAGSAELSLPFGIAVDSVDDLFISDTSNNRVREVASGATAVTVTTATPTVTVSDANGPYTGQPFAATATATGVGGASVSGTFAFTYYVGSTVSGQGSSTPPSAPGTYTVTAAFTSGNADYSNASGGPVTFTISQAGPTVSAPTSATLYQNGSLTFSTANGDPISVSDSAASGKSDSITLSVSDGALKFTSTTGLKFTAGSNNSASMTVNGTLASLNAALQTLKYTPTSGFNGFDFLNVTVSDAVNSTSGSATVDLTILGPPTLTAPSTANVNENAALVFSSSNSNAITLADPAATATSDTLTLTVNHGTLGLGSTAGLTFTAGANNSTTMTVTGTLSSLQAALSGLTYTPKTSYSGAASLTLKVKDSASGFNATASVAITVVVPASTPTVTVSTQIPTSVPGEPVPLVFEVSDSNSVANSSNFTLAITFGDGKSANVTSSNDLIVNHVYTKAGTYTVSVTATDEYGAVSTVATTTINVVPAALEINPFNPSQTALFVGGTTGKDTVTFTASGNGIAVTLNKVNEGTFVTSGPLIVFGQGGADVVNVGAGIPNTEYLLETANADNVETDLDNDAIQWAGLSSAVEILNE